MQSQQSTRLKKTGFACFLSHYKIEAATEARWLQRELEEALGERVFLDSDDLHDLSRLKDHVRESKCLLLLQTRSVLTRLWCLVELVTAIDAHQKPSEASQSSDDFGVRKAASASVFEAIGA